MIKLDPNSWLDAELWYEDEPEIFEFMRNNYEKINKYAKDNRMTIKDSIDYLFKNRK